MAVSFRSGKAGTSVGERVVWHDHEQRHGMTLSAKDVGNCGVDSAKVDLGRIRRTIAATAKCTKLCRTFWFQLAGCPDAEIRYAVPVCDRRSPHNLRPNLALKAEITLRTSTNKRLQLEEMSRESFATGAASRAQTSARLCTRGGKGRGRGDEVTKGAWCTTLNLILVSRCRACTSGIASLKRGSISRTAIV